MKEIQQPRFATYKFYDEKGRRLSIFADNIECIAEGNEVMVTVFTCSKADVFSKKRARELYAEHTNPDLPFNEEINPIAYTVKLDETKPHDSFIEWCHQNFYYKVRGQIYAEMDFLYKGTKGTRLKETAKFYVKNKKTQKMESWR